MADEDSKHPTCLKLHTAARKVFAMAILPSLTNAATAHISSLPIAKSALSIKKSCRASAELASAFLGTNFGLKRAVLQQVEAKRSLVVEAKRMESQEVAVTRAPDFELPEPLTGKTWKLEDFEPYPALLVMFICNHCPFVVHLKSDLAKLANNYIPKGLAVVAISSNSVQTHPEDGPAFMAEDAKEYGYPFPYLYDETQEVAKAYGAVCTPDFFLFKKDGRRPFELAYHGRFDDSRPRSNTAITGRDIRVALDCVLSGRPIHPTKQFPSIGCSIKWNPVSSNQ